MLLFPYNSREVSKETAFGILFFGLLHNFKGGYYMNKTHWNSVKAEGEVPDDLLKDMLDKAYQLVLDGLSKKKQREILGDDK